MKWSFCEIEGLRYKTVKQSNPIHQSCQELKNYEATFAIVNGLQSLSEQEVGGAMFLVTEQRQATHKELKELASSDMNYHRYRQEIRPLQQSTTIPYLSKSFWWHTILSFKFWLPTLHWAYMYPHTH